MSTNITRRHNISPRPAFEVGPGHPKKRSRCPAIPGKAPLEASALEPAGLGGPAFFIQKQLCQDFPQLERGFPIPAGTGRRRLGRGRASSASGIIFFPCKGLRASLQAGRRWKNKYSASFPPGSKAILAQPVKTVFLS